MHCSKQSSRKQQALLSCFTPWDAEHRYLLHARVQVTCLLGEKCLLWHRSKTSKAFHSCLSCFSSFPPSHLKIWLIFVFHFLLKSWQQTTCFGCTFVSKDMIDTQSVHISRRHCTCAHQAGFRCFRRHTIRVIHLVSRVKLCHWQNPYINSQLVIWLRPEEKKIDSLGDFTVL